MSVNFPIRGSQASVKPPICAICTPGDEPRIVLAQKGEGVRHWPNDGHAPTGVFLGDGGRSVTKRRDETPNNVTSCDENTPGVTKRGRPKKHANRAAQQAAYRRRHG